MWESAFKSQKCGSKFLLSGNWVESCYIYNFSFILAPWKYCTFQNNNRFLLKIFGIWNLFVGEIFFSFFYIFSYIFFLDDDVWITTDFINLIAATWSTNDWTAFDWCSDHPMRFTFRDLVLCILRETYFDFNADNLRKCTAFRVGGIKYVRGAEIRFGAMSYALQLPDKPKIVLTFL